MSLGERLRNIPRERVGLAGEHKRPGDQLERHPGDRRRGAGRCHGNCARAAKWGREQRARIYSAGQRARRNHHDSGACHDKHGGWRYTYDSGVQFDGPGRYRVGVDVSDPTVVSLSTDNPPVLTALAAGHVTVTAGTASADVTVSADALPLGTVIWSNPGNGSGVSNIVPAVPSPSGVADVFAFQNDGTVQAVTADGTTAWTADVSQAEYTVNGQLAVPDFQGGLVSCQPGSFPDYSIVKYDE